MRNIYLNYVALSFILLGMGASQGALANSSTQPANTTTLICSLKVSDSSGVSTDWRFQEVNVPMVKADSFEDANSVEVFSELNSVFVQKYNLPLHFVVSSFTQKSGRFQAPQLHIGISYYNKFAKNQRSLHSEAVGDLRTFASYRSGLGNSAGLSDNQPVIEFTCRNKTYSLDI